ncbi:hypothetical protein PIROE2DRAFT_21496 [Piromyces sp. E2]|nr:hypothetical protein PIROE2DRAFT_21496 [Piromyces sp. E2]|eukprot:OUM57436.1 hypothetical protein PIROE2DRAFT_21496 [Piromyces sp. E2]
MKIIKFPKSPIECDFKSVDILCYETNSCTFVSTLNFLQYTECTAKDIDMIRYSLPMDDEVFPIMIIAIVVMTISVLVSIFCISLDICNNRDSTNNNNNYLNSRRNSNNYSILPSYQEAIDTSNENSNNYSDSDSNVGLLDDIHINYQDESGLPTYEDVLKLSNPPY